MNSRIHRIIGWSLREAILKFKKDENQSSELLEKKSGRTIKIKNHIKQNQKVSREKGKHLIKKSSSTLVHMINLSGLFLLNERHSQCTAQLISMIENLFSISNIRI